MGRIASWTPKPASPRSWSCPLARSAIRSGRGAQTRNSVVPSPIGRAPSGRSKGRGGSDMRSALEGGRRARRLELGDRLSHRVDLRRERLHSGGVALTDGRERGPALVHALLHLGEMPLDLLVLWLHGHGP